MDGKRNDKLSVHVRRLARKTTYIYRLESAPKACAADAPGGTPVPGWKYKPLKTNKAGVANSKATSRTFTVSRSVEYFVAVYRTTATGAMGELALCAKLTSKHVPKPKHEKPKHHKPKHDKPKPTSRSTTRTRRSRSTTSRTGLRGSDPFRLPPT